MRLNASLGERQLLWVDVAGQPTDDIAEALAQRMDLGPRTRRDLLAAAGPHISIHGPYLHVRVAAPGSGDGQAGEPAWLDLVAARDMVTSLHRRPIELLSDFDQRIEADATAGQMDGFAFVRSVLDAVVTGYLQMLDEIEGEIDELDGQALHARSGGKLLARLVDVRRRIARARRLLSAQREVFAILGSADVETITDAEQAAGFRAVATRFEGALRSVEDARDLLIGSFDVFMTRTAQRTNEVMKALALATALLLPGSLIAGLLGMNVVVPLPKDSPWSFWLVVAAILAFAGAVLVVARTRRWI